MADNSDAAEFAALTASLRRHLRQRQHAGIRTLPKTELSEIKPVIVKEAEAESALGGTAADLFADNKAALQADSLENLRAAIGDCKLCKLCSGRTHIVFGVGNPRAKLCNFRFGEGPGRDEDLQGEPFVGRAGQLLTDIITKGMKLRREDVYIANVVKCRPPANRNPEPDEVAACEPFLKGRSIWCVPRSSSALASLRSKLYCKAKCRSQRCGALGTVITALN